MIKGNIGLRRGGKSKSQTQAADQGAAVSSPPPESIAMTLRLGKLLNDASETLAYSQVGRTGDRPSLGWSDQQIRLLAIWNAGGFNLAR
jgi:hypothetical protein